MPCLTSGAPAVCPTPWCAAPVLSLPQVYDMAQQEMEYRVGLFNA